MTARRYTQKMYEADRAAKERERQKNIAQTTTAIEALEDGQGQEGIDLRHPIAVLRIELERLRR